MKHAISWFEIPVKDMDRAATFYEAIFGFTMIPLETPQFRMRMFPTDDRMSVGGTLMESTSHTPSATDGPLIYLNGNPDLQVILDKVEGAGGKILMPKTEISPEYGFMGLFLDTEGNRIALHNIPEGMQSS
mgnify:FL=1